MFGKRLDETEAFSCEREDDTVFLLGFSLPIDDTLFPNITPSKRLSKMRASKEDDDGDLKLGFSFGEEKRENLNL